MSTHSPNDRRLAQTERERKRGSGGKRTLTSSSMRTGIERLEYFSLSSFERGADMIVRRTEEGAPKWAL